MAWTLHHGDCLDPIAGLTTLLDRGVDHVISDPPYEAEAHAATRRVGKKAAPLDFAAMDERTRTLVGAHFARIARRWILVFCQVEGVHLWRAALEAGGANYIRTGVWVRPDSQPSYSGDRPAAGYDSIVIAHARTGRLRWNGGGRRGVWTFNKSDVVGVPHVHMTQKPVALMSALITDFTDPNELILDPFAGSGTTGVAAIHNGRRFVGWEREARYHAIASKRMDRAREQLALFTFGLGGSTE